MWPSCCGGLEDAGHAWSCTTRPSSWCEKVDPPAPAARFSVPSVLLSCIANGHYFCLTEATSVLPKPQLFNTNCLCWTDLPLFTGNHLCQTDTASVQQKLHLTNRSHICSTGPTTVQLKPLLCSRSTLLFLNRRCLCSTPIFVEKSCSSANIFMGVLRRKKDMSLSQRPSHVAQANDHRKRTSQTSRTSRDMD